MGNKKEVEHSVALAKKMEAHLNGEKVTEGGAAIGYVMAGWVMQVPAEHRNTMLELLNTYARDVIALMSDVEKMKGKQ